MHEEKKPLFLATISTALGVLARPREAPYLRDRRTRFRDYNEDQLTVRARISGALCQNRTSKIMIGIGFLSSSELSLYAHWPGILLFALTDQVTEHIKRVANHSTVTVSILMMEGSRKGINQAEDIGYAVHRFSSIQCCCSILPER
jgi:hypothetical protein